MSYPFMKNRRGYKETYSLGIYRIDYQNFIRENANSKYHCHAEPVEAPPKTRLMNAKRTQTFRQRYNAVSGNQISRRD